MTTILFYLFLIAATIYAVFKLKYELHMMQQNSYRNERYFRWLKSNLLRADRVLELFFLAIGLVLNFIYLPLGIVVTTLAMLFLSWRFFNKKHKKALVLTDRAKRILGLSLVLFVGFNVFFLRSFFDTASASTLILKTSFALSILSFIASPIIEMLSVFLLKPYEKYNHNWYINDAKKILKANSNLTVVGITGSYGKTSVKHFLQSILAQKYNVLMTPGSFNTPMGVVRTVREQLKPFHEVFIAEMGAKQIGDIKEICDIANPSIGILTAVGTAHLDTFKTQENIRKTKFELIDSLPQDGFAVLNLDYPMIETQPVSKPKIYYSTEKSKADFTVQDISVTPRGSKFSVFKKGEKIGDFETKLLGEHNLSNLAAAISVADYLGVSPQQMSVGIKKIMPVEHRLSIRKIGGGITVLDDAFNSNPVGARMAVEVLGLMEGKRKIIVTPGMVEMGDKAEEFNSTFGMQIADHADLAIIVGQTNKEAITAGLKSKSFPDNQIYHARDFADATKWLGARMQAGDVILYENDLPDSYK